VSNIREPEIRSHVCTVRKPVYNITKFGLRALAQSISAEGAGKIRSFTVSTGFVKWEVTSSLMAEWC
jgi:NAD(P)-dependent dehydrogenase (short-subunit alcohol dehydrogenase family)